MNPTLRPRVKVCCIASWTEAHLAIELGACALGLVGQMPSGPGIIPDGLIADIAAMVPPPIATFLLTSEQTAAGIIAHHRRVRTTAIQMVDTLAEGSYDQLRDGLPGVKLVQVIHVTGQESLYDALAAAPHVDALLLDSGYPELPVKELGGTGRLHDWRVSRQIRESADVPVFLAGGLRVDNVRDAIAEVEPFGLDLCTGVRTDGRLDRAKLAPFMAAVRESWLPDVEYP
jgi:phosphoribosylanthranilate isomerase